MPVQNVSTDSSVNPGETSLTANFRRASIRM